MHETTKAVLKSNAGRDPDRVHIKLKALRDDPFTFFRGTAPLYFSTLEMPRLLQRSPKVVACGDLHLENFASYKGDNRLVYFDISDFDEACVVPLTYDLVRFAASVLVAAKYLKIGGKQAQALVVRFIDAYAATMVSTKPRWVERASATGPIKSLLQRVKNQHRRDLISQRCVQKKGRTTLIADGKKALPVTARQRDTAKSILAAYASTCEHPAHFESVDIARRIAGIGSLGLERYVVLVRGDGSSDGRYLVDIKIANPSALAATLQSRQPAWKSDAERVVTMQRVSQAIPPDLLGAVGMGKHSYIIKELQPTADRVNLRALDGNKRSLDNVVRTMAEVIAWAHLRGGSRFGAESIEKLAAYAHGNVWKGMLQAVAQESATLAFTQWQEFAADYDQSGNAFADAL